LRVFDAAIVTFDHALWCLFCFTFLAFYWHCYWILIRLHISQIVCFFQGYIKGFLIKFEVSFSCFEIDDVAICPQIIPYSRVLHVIHVISASPVHNNIYSSPSVVPSISGTFRKRTDEHSALQYF
jgi:hypothetical protein